ncbi:MAG: glycosyltransferase family 2 protein [bacterium]|nr:glycosyltransferase family 2 protein [bacterium]
MSADNPKPYYLRVGKAPDLALSGERALYRFFEVLPGALAWGTLGGSVLFSWLWPVGVAVFIIAFDVYWLLKTVYLSVHLIAAYHKLRRNTATDWLKKLDALIFERPEGIEKFSDHSVTPSLRHSITHWHDLWHLVILPFYDESSDIIHSSLASIAAANYPKDRMIVVLASEARSGQRGQDVSRVMQAEFGGLFAKFLITAHPADIPGEIAGKGSNEAWAAKQAKAVIDQMGIPYDRIIMSVFDSDTRAYPDYFACLAWHYLTCENPTRSSFQPVPVFNNNIWQAPFFSRVVATSSTFWHMMKQEAQERMTTFSSHSMSFTAIVEMGFWQTNIVSEDSRVFWQALLTFDGDYRVVPLHYPVSMDACLAHTWWQTVKNQYKQQRRWGWGVENVPYMLFGFWKNRAMPFGNKLYFTFMQFEGFWSWSTNAILIFLLGWLPLALGGEAFNQSVLSYRLPLITRTLMTLALVGMFISAGISLLLLPPRPRHFSWTRHIGMALQWLILPVSIMFLGAFPGIEAQTRLMLGKYMGFWVTEKARKESAPSL